MITYITFIIELLTGIKNMACEFYLISNEHVTAGFLARFIAKKLKQHLGLRRTLNPIRRELSRVLKEDESDKYNYLINSRPKFQALGKDEADIKSY
jgi:hypothetical protein